METPALPEYMKKENIFLICILAALVSFGVSIFLVNYVNTPKDFSIFVIPDNGSINIGEYIQTNVIVLGENNYSRSVSLSARNLPAGIKVTFLPQNGIIPACSSIMTIETNKTLSNGDYKIYVWGLASDGKEHKKEYKLNINRQ